MKGVVGFLFLGLLIIVALSFCSSIDPIAGEILTWY